MKVKLAGTKIRSIREALGLTVPQFASVIAVHPGTVHRWEGAGSAEVPVDGVAASVLMSLDMKVKNDKAAFDAEQVGKQVVQTLLVGGALLALGFLIAQIAKEGK